MLVIPFVCIFYIIGNELESFIDDEVTHPSSHSLVSICDELVHEDGSWYLLRIVCLMVIKQQFGIRILPKPLVSNGVEISFEGYECGASSQVCETVPLKKSSTAKAVAEFLHSLRFINYIGSCIFDVPTIGAVKYPVDYFLARMYKIKFRSIYDIARNTYRRVNPTLAMKLKQLMKYDKSFSLDRSIKRALDEVVTEMLGELTFHPYFVEFAKEVNDRFSRKEAMFEDLKVNGSSAAGFPYKPGVKRRDVRSEAESVAFDLFNNDYAFDEYMQEHVWYSTGRAKLVKQGSEDKARLVLYGGVAGSLLGFLYSQSWTKFMNKACFKWSAVGMSWMHEGASKLAKFFGANGLNAPDGFEFVSIDVSEWDSSVCTELMNAARDFHRRMLVQILEPEHAHYIRKFNALYTDMIHSKVVIPGKNLVQLHSGMKSGWIMTANDNTLIHEFVTRTLEKIDNIPIMKRRLYGDDNLSLKPVGFDVSIMTNSYAKFGFKLSRFHISKHLDEVDFLSKYIKFDGNSYFPWRPSVETHARLLMPEEFEPAMRIVPDARVTAEHLLGHLFDNPFNAEVRKVIYDLLYDIKMHNGIETIEVSERALEKWKMMGLDVTRMKGIIPIIPDIKFIEHLYGVSTVPVSFSWSDSERLALAVPKFEFIHKAQQCGYYMRSQAHAIKASLDVKLAHRRNCMLNRLCSYKTIPEWVHGRAGGKLLEILNSANIASDSILDLGSHPGAAVSTLQHLNMFKRAVCVSVFPQIDKEKGFCPRIVRDGRVEFVIHDANNYVTNEKFDVCFDDIYDFESSKKFTHEHQVISHYNEHFIGAKHRALRYYDNVNAYIVKIRGITPDVIDGLYDVYKKYGKIDIRKPFYSYAWNPELYVVFSKKSSNAFRKATFKQAFNAYLNKLVPRMDAYVGGYAYNYSQMIEGKEVMQNPFRNDERVQALIDNFVRKRTSGEYDCDLSKFL